MEVFDGLSAVSAGVDDQAIAIVETLAAGDLAGGGQQGAKQGGVGRQGIRVGGEVAFGDHKHVHWGLWVDVGEGEGFGGLVQALDRDGARDDFTEEAVGRRIRHTADNTWATAPLSRMPIGVARVSRSLGRIGTLSRTCETKVILTPFVRESRIASMPSFAKATLFLWAAVLTLCAPRSACAEQVWTEIRSPHFRVLTDASAGDARKVAYEFEQIRHVFVLRFNNENVGSGAPLTIFAVRNDGTLSEVAPMLWKARGDTLAGFFEHRWEEQFALVRLDTWGDNNQVVAYHEYAHSVLHANARWLPTWLDEGMAEFYAYSQFEHARTLIGTPSRRSPELHNKQLLPISTMLALDQRSPYYRDEFKMQLFYAEAWAMVHYMMFGPGMGNGAKLNAFFKALTDGTPQLQAFQAVFGDVSAFDKGFSQYVMQSAFTAGVLPVGETMDPKTFAERKLSAAEARFEIGRFQIGIHDGANGAVSLDKALAADPKLAAAHEELAYLDFDHGKDEEAKKEWGAAVALDPDLPRSIFALTMTGKPIAQQSPEELGATRSTLQHVTVLAPKFAPAYVELAEVEELQGKKQQAYRDAQQAEALEPWRAGYHLLTGRILLMGNQPAVAANYSRFVAARWFGSDRNEAVDLLQQVPADQRGTGPEPTLDLPSGVQVVRGMFTEVSCGTGGAETKLKVTMQPDTPAGAKPITFLSNIQPRIGFPDTMWWGGDHFNHCYHMAGHRGLVAYKAGISPAQPQLVTMEMRDESLDRLAPVGVQSAAPVAAPTTQAKVVQEGPAK